jgi:gliding motility-associated-like protein
MSTSEGSASMANASNGNLLFYTDGSTIWDHTHSVMANGSGLNGHFSSAQSSLILKKPGSSTLYYVFSQQGQNVFSGGLYYSIVDMSLAAGSGSVTVKNASLYQPSCEKVTATKHCNGVDYWVLSHDYGSSVFRAHLLTSTGMSSVVVTSTLGTSVSNVNLSLGVLKISPNGKKIGHTLQGNAVSGVIELYDFDNATGVVSNALVLNNTLFSCYGCEFSPDCTKFYCTVGSTNAGLYQWNLCAGSSSSVIASKQTIYTGAPATWFIQLADNGKIYSARGSQSTLGVINNPNALGTACNYTTAGPSVAPQNALLGLPNFVLSSVKPLPPPFTYTVNPAQGCQTAFFTTPAVVQTYTTVGCVSSGYSVTGLSWNFGDPASGSANTSSLSAPSHSYSAPGTYTAQLVIQYSCGGGADTLKQTVTVGQGCMTVTSASISCATLGSATVTGVGTGPFSYTWMPGSQNGSVATNLTPGTYTVYVHDNGANITSSVVAVLTSPVPLTGTLSQSGSVTCMGAPTGTASFTNISGGSGNQLYLWSNGTTSYTTASAGSLTAGTWSVTVTDALTGCQFSQAFSISQPSFNLVLSASASTACSGGSVVLTGTNSGGLPGYSYTWTGGPTASAYTVSEASPGSYIYTLSSGDGNNCVTSGTVGVSFVPLPAIAVSNTSICPLTVGTLTASGATTYTWNSVAGNTTFSDSPSVTTSYTVTGSSFGCSNSATATIFVKPPPLPTINSNNPVCQGGLLALAAHGGSSYVWSGPNNFTSTTQFPLINPANLINSGIYTLVATAANGCTASATETVVVNPLPNLSASAGTVCTSQSLTLSANSNGSFFQWTGPQNFSSTVQSAVIANAQPAQSGTYVVKAISAQGCTASAVAVASVISPPSLTVTLSSGTLCAQALNGSPNSLTLNSGGANTYTLMTPYHIGNSNPAGPSSTLTSLPPPISGMATATLMGSNGVCTVSVTVDFSVIPNPTVTILTPTPVICAGESYTYTSQGATSYTWGPLSPNLTTYTSPVTVASPTVTSVYSVFGGSLGCNSGTQTSTITVNPLPVISIEPRDPAVCLHGKLTLKAMGTATTYSWMPGSGLNTIYGPTVSASPPAQQAYTITGSLNSCTASAAVTVSVLPLPQPTAVVLNPTVCLKGQVTLHGTGGDRYQWEGPAHLTFAGQTVTFTAASPLYSGIYTLTVRSANNCSNTAEAMLRVLDLPGGNLSGKMDGCVPFCSEFTFHPFTGTSIPIASWNIEGQNVVTKKFSHCFTAAGAYVITGNFSDTLCGCVNTETFAINVYPQPNADFEFFPEKPVENGDPVEFKSTSEGEQLHWSWYFINNHGYRSHQEKTSNAFQDAGIYPVALVVSNTWGCSDTVIKAVKVEQDFNIYVPDAFTPNDDGRNDFFFPVMRGIRKYNLSVFDRWGRDIFSTNDPSAAWDGTYKGEICQSGVYTWKIIAWGTLGEPKEMVGHVTLYR